jgi:hypothetical protein
MIRSMIAATIASLLVITSAPVAALEPALTAAEQQSAIRDGRAIAFAHQGYPVSTYTVFEVPDALAITPGGGYIDAVVVATPFERARYASYLAYFQQSSPSSDEIARASRADEVDFLIFAHSSANMDRGFLSGFRAAAISSGRSVQLTPVSHSTFGPTIDFYNVAGRGRQPRLVGFDTFRFDLRPLVARGVDVSRLRGTFAITDPYGRAYSLAFDLSKMR